MLRSKRCIVQIVVEKLKDGERYCPYCGTKTFNEYEFNQQRVDYAISRRSIPNVYYFINCYVWNLWTLLALLSC